MSMGSASDFPLSPTLSTSTCSASDESSSGGDSSPASSTAATMNIGYSHLNTPVQSTEQRTMTTMTEIGRARARRRRSGSSPSRARPEAAVATAADAFHILPTSDATAAQVATLAPQPQPPPPPHPFASMHHDQEPDEDLCPVCLCELSLKLKGEKPHVVPVCFHRLHHDCFEAVYGSFERARSSRTSLGLCGICRKDMKIGEGGDAPGKRNKFAAMAGLPGADERSSHKLHSTTRGTLRDQEDRECNRHDPGEDDDLVVQVQSPSAAAQPAGFSPSNRDTFHTDSTSSTITASRRGSVSTAKGSASSIYHPSPFDVVRPFITTRAEHERVERSIDRDKKQHMTCMVTVEMPSRWPTPVPYVDGVATADRERVHLPPPRLDSRTAQQRRHLSPQTSPMRPSALSSSPTTSSLSDFAHSPTSPDRATMPHGPFQAVVNDLRARMADWKGHSLDEFGALKLYDLVSVRKDANTREFSVYLFEEAILCVTDDKRKGQSGDPAIAEKLRLKGRVYVRHIRSLIDTSNEQDLSLTITMSDDAMDEFVMAFKDQHSLKQWRSQIDHLLTSRHLPSPPLPPAPIVHSSPTRGMIASASHDSFAASEYSHASQRTHSSGFSGYTRTTTSSAPLSSSTIHEEGDCDEYSEAQRYAAAAAAGSPSSSRYPPSSYSAPSSYPRLAASASSSAFGPREFTPLDLMLVISVPSTRVGAGPSTLKLGIIKASLTFLLDHVGPRTRLSIVAFSAGDSGRGVLRKTPYLAVGKADGRARLQAAINELGSVDDDDEESREGKALVEHKEERVNVVTAVNLALDIVLQRKAKSALSGIVLVNDGRDGAQKQQMDLVMARAEAANIPIHALGWGKSHDPSSLWLLSNHTGGSYAFVRNFYDLRDALAGVVGGILSIAATNVRLHIAVPEHRWFRIRKVSGTPGAIVAKSGTDVDIDLGEMRFGEKKDLLVEVEMSLGGYGDDIGAGRAAKRVVESSTGTAGAFGFLSKAGLDPSALEEYSAADLYDEEYESMPDEVPLFEVNAAYRDPAAGKTVARLNNTPTLLTVTLVPSTSSADKSTAPSNSPDITRRRMELLSSDMLSRSLLLMTRRNDNQAKRLLEETKRIIATIASSLASTPGSARQPSRPSSSLSHARRTLEACAEDVQAALESCMDRTLFEQQGRYAAAQHAVVLRDQRAWGPKSASERLFWTADNSLWLVGKSQQWLDSR